jgi:predicted enzyme related to lactoylglutathione lyase
MNPVVHFEMPYESADRVSKFYKTVFGWSMQPQGQKMGDYVLARTTQSDGDGWPKKVGRINGGFFPRKPDWPAQVPSLVISVDNIRTAMAKVREAGGTVLGEPMAIPGVGDYVSFTDSEGNRVSIIQPLPMSEPKAPKVAKRRPAAKKRSAPAKRRAKKARHK